jgi:zinc-binding alcohol dehydrogenase family protein
MQAWVYEGYGAPEVLQLRDGNVDAARKLGADRVIDYTQEDFTRSAGEHDVMLDIPGNRTWSECKQAEEDGKLVLVSGPKTNRWVGPLGHMVSMRLASLRGGREAKPFVATLTGDDLPLFAELMRRGPSRRPSTGASSCTRFPPCWRTSAKGTRGRRSSSP